MISKDWLGSVDLRGKVVGVWVHRKYEPLHRSVTFLRRADHSRRAQCLAKCLCGNMATWESR